MEDYTYSQFLSYIIDSFSRIAMGFQEGIKWFKAGIKPTFDKVSTPTEWYDMENARGRICDGVAFSFIISVIGTVLTSLLTIFSGGGLLLIFECIGLLVPYFLTTLFIFLAHKYKYWKKWIVSLMIVLYFISIIITTFGVVSNIFKLLGSLAHILATITVFVSIAEKLGTLLSMGLLESGLYQAIPVDEEIVNNYKAAHGKLVGNTDQNYQPYQNPYPEKRNQPFQNPYPQQNNPVRPTRPNTDTTVDFDNTEIDLSNNDIKFDD